MSTELPIPGFVDKTTASRAVKVPYEDIAKSALAWRAQHKIPNSDKDIQKVALLGIDQQVTFCVPGFELYVGGRSGVAAVEDSIRFSEFIYRNLHRITKLFLTMDTHKAFQIFHPSFLVDENGNHPAPYTMILPTDVMSGKWHINPMAASAVREETQGNLFLWMESWLRHYVSDLENRKKFVLMIWPYHAMLGGIGHALVPMIEEAAFFHDIIRGSQTQHETKGGNPYTENYSVLSPEVLTHPDGNVIAQGNTKLIQALISYDRLIIGGQAKSHCVAWTIQNLLDELKDKSLAKKVYILEDCTSPVVTPAYDFTDQTNTIFDNFRAAGMNLVKSTTPMSDWPNFN